LTTCGGVSFAHGSNDGQKGMGLILLALIGFLPTYYSLDVHQPGLAAEVRNAAIAIDQTIEKQSPALAATIQPEMKTIVTVLEGKESLAEISPADRWQVRQSILRFRQKLSVSSVAPETRAALADHNKALARSIEFVPFWVILSVALALGIGTTVGYKRIVVTVAEKIGKSHLTYAQGAAAETIAAATIGLADIFHMPVSTTHVLSSGIAGTMWANRSGIQADTVKKLGLAWVLTLPAAILLSAALFTLGGSVVPGAGPHSLPAKVNVSATERSPAPPGVDGLVKRQP
jgi:phosphate/sulfate permease